MTYWITNCMHCTYTRRLLMQDMLFHRCAGVEGVTMPETYSIRKRGVLFQFWCRSSVRKFLFFALRCHFGLWTEWVFLNVPTGNWVYAFQSDFRHFDLLFFLRSLCVYKYCCCPFFVSLNWERTSRRNKASSRRLFVHYLSAITAKVNLTCDHIANGGRKHEYSFNAPFPTEFKLLARTKLKNINIFRACSRRVQLWCGY